MDAVGQTRIESIVEAALNIASGFILSYLAWMFVVGPIFGIKSGPGECFSITLIFTGISLVRSYLWRRYFNKRLIVKLTRG